MTAASTTMDNLSIDPPTLTGLPFFEQIKTALAHAENVSFSLRQDCAKRPTGPPNDQADDRRPPASEQDLNVLRFKLNELEQLNRQVRHLHNDLVYRPIRLSDDQQIKNLKSKIECAERTLTGRFDDWKTFDSDWKTELSDFAAVNPIVKLNEPNKVSTDIRPTLCTTNGVGGGSAVNAGLTGSGQSIATINRTISSSINPPKELSTQFVAPSLPISKYLSQTAAVINPIKSRQENAVSCNSDDEMGGNSTFVKEPSADPSTRPTMGGIRRDFVITTNNYGSSTNNASHTLTSVSSAFLEQMKDHRKPLLQNCGQAHSGFGSSAAGMRSCSTTNSNMQGLQKKLENLNRKMAQRIEDTSDLNLMYKLPLVSKSGYEYQHNHLNLGYRSGKTPLKENALRNVGGNGGGDDDDEEAEFTPGMKVVKRRTPNAQPLLEINSESPYHPNDKRNGVAKDVLEMTQIYNQKSSINNFSAFPSPIKENFSAEVKKPLSDVCKTPEAPQIKLRYNQF